VFIFFYTKHFVLTVFLDDVHKFVRQEDLFLACYSRSIYLYGLHYQQRQLIMLRGGWSTRKFLLFLTSVLRQAKKQVKTDNTKYLACWTVLWLKASN